MPVTPMSSLTCPAIADNQSPVKFQFSAGCILTFFMSLIFICCFGIFFVLLCNFPQFLLLIEKLPSFLRNQNSRTSNKCKMRKMKSGIFSHFWFVSDLADYNTLRASEFYIILFLFVFCWDLPFDQ